MKKILAHLIILTGPKLPFIWDDSIIGVLNETIRKLYSFQNGFYIKHRRFLHLPLKQTWTGAIMYPGNVTASNPKRHYRADFNIYQAELNVCLN